MSEPDETSVRTILKLEQTLFDLKAVVNSLECQIDLLKALAYAGEEE